MIFDKIGCRLKTTFYHLVRKKIGCEVVGIDLNSENRPEVIEEIKKHVTEHHLLLFSNQGAISGNRQVEITKWFGELQPTIYKHPKSPRPDVYRLSNDEAEGFRAIFSTSWHIDGAFLSKPYAYSLYHMVSVPTDGATIFLPLTKFIENIESNKLVMWDRLWMINRRNGQVHPLIYRHPKTKKPVLCVHLGRISHFIRDYQTNKERLISLRGTAELKRDILTEIAVKNKHLLYSHKVCLGIKIRSVPPIQAVENVEYEVIWWKPGEFIITDNLAVGHAAAPESHYPRNKVGLRVLHRTTVKGTEIPRK